MINGGISFIEKTEVIQISDREVMSFSREELELLTQLPVVAPAFGFRMFKNMDPSSHTLEIDYPVPSITMLPEKEEFDVSEQ